MSIDRTIFHKGGYVKVELTPIRAIRFYCIGCAGSEGSVRVCEHSSCTHYPFRMGRRTKSDHTPVKSIRLQCKSCMCESSHEVKHCPSVTCPTYPYRMGRRPQS